MERHNAGLATATTSAIASGSQVSQSGGVASSSAKNVNVTYQDPNGQNVNIENGSVVSPDSD